MRGVQIIVMVMALAMASPACKCSDQAGQRAPGEVAASWAHGRWKFSQSSRSPAAGWVEFAPEGRRGAIRVVDYACPPETGCKTDGTFKAGEDSITLQVRQWNDESFKVHTTDKAMEWTHDGEVIVRLSFIQPPAPPSPNQEEDRPLACKEDADCPRVLSCGPCKPDQPITSLHLRVACYKNPCPGREAYCTEDGICAVKPLIP